MFQDDQEIVRVAQQWMASIQAGKRNGKQYLGSNGLFSAENSQRILDYAMKCYREISFVSLDKSLDFLARGNQLVGFETKLSGGDISRGESHGSISLESNGGIRTLIERMLNKRVAAEKAEAADQSARHAGYKPLPNREISEAEMKAADPRALRDWLNRRRGSDTAKIQD